MSAVWPRREEGAVIQLTYLAGAFTETLLWMTVFGRYK